MAWSKINDSPNFGLYLSLLFVGFPVFLVVIALLLWTQHPADHIRVTNAQSWIEPLKTTQFDTRGFEQLATELPDFSKANWETISFPNSIPLSDAVDISPQAPMARAWFKFEYQLPQNVGKIPDYAIYDTRIMGGAYMVWVNDELAHVNLKNWKVQWNYPVFVPIPMKLIQPNAKIEVKIAIPYRVSQGYAIGSLYIGKAEPLSLVRDIRNSLQVKFCQFVTGFMLLVGLMSFHLWLSRKQQTANLILALASMAILICNFQWFYEISNHELASKWYNSLVDSSVMWVITLVYFYAKYIGKINLPKFERFLILATVALTIATLPIWGQGEYALLLQCYFEALMGLVITGILIYHVKGSSLEFKLITFAQGMLIGFGVHDTLYMTTQLTPDGIYTFPYASLGMIFTFIFASQREHIQALSQVENLNDSLARTLNQRENELRIQHERLIEIERSRALLLERQRLVRDMHDGIGSSLMTTLNISKQGQISPDKMAEVLTDCLDDLKNVIESLEPIEHDLSTLLGMLRARLGKRLEQAGMKLEWVIKDIPQLTWLEPPQALQISRIVQEVMANILKHAQAKHIKLHADITKIQGGKDAILVSISDNGNGFDENMKYAGRGLKNIHYRANEIGAFVQIHSATGEGTRVEIYLPIEI